MLKSVPNYPHRAASAHAPSSAASFSLQLPASSASRAGEAHTAPPPFPHFPCLGLTGLFRSRPFLSLFLPTYLLAFPSASATVSSELAAAAATTTVKLPATSLTYTHMRAEHGPYIPSSLTHTYVESPALFHAHPYPNACPHQYRLKRVDERL
jgi:hypothetical protein